MIPTQGIIERGCGGPLSVSKYATPRIMNRGSLGLETDAGQNPFPCTIYPVGVFLELWYMGKDSHRLCPASTTPIPYLKGTLPVPSTLRVLDMV